MNDIAKIKAEIVEIEEGIRTRKRWGQLPEIELKNLRFKLRAELTNGIPIDELETLCEAWRDGRVAVLPVKVGSKVYIIKESCFDCDNCEFKAEAKFSKKINRVCCDFLDDRHCPYYIEEQVAEGFNVSGKDGKAFLSDPGRWGYEGLEQYCGEDNKWYPTREAAADALKGEAT